MSKTAQPLLSHYGWGIVPPWGRRPFVRLGITFSRRDAVAQLNEKQRVTRTIGAWRALGWRFVRVEIRPMMTASDQPARSPSSGTEAHP